MEPEPEAQPTSQSTEEEGEELNVDVVPVSVVESEKVLESHTGEFQANSASKYSY